MKSFYDILGITKDADAQTIKRAYFGKVREFPPERFPDEFKQIRNAYDTLSDDKARAVYDRRGNIPEYAALVISNARGMLMAGKQKQALDAMTELTMSYPDSAEIKIELARMYEELDKYGKSAEVWSELCAVEPDNTRYASELAWSYLRRGWVKKAMAEFTRITRLDPGDPDGWEGITECLDTYTPELAKVCKAGIEALSNKGVESLKLNVYAFACASDSGDTESATAYFDKSEELLAAKKYTSRNDAISAFDCLLDSVMKSRSYEYLPELKRVSGMIPDINKEFSGKLDYAAKVAKISKFAHDDFPNLFTQMFVRLLGDNLFFDDADLDVKSMECSILADLNGYRPYIKRLKTEYPDLYATHAEFFGQAMLTKTPDKLMYPRLKALKRSGYEPELVPATGKRPQKAAETEDTERREVPKVGRNEPCPCGSGKKYKKCCGR